MKHKLFILNFGSTSTKIAIYENEEILFEQTLRHEASLLQQYPTSVSQKDYRLGIILDFLKENNIKLDDIDAFIGRGGLTKPVEGGTYIVNKEMVKDLESMAYGDHVSNLGGIIAFDLANRTGKPAYIVDPVVVDELDDIARITGYKGFTRKSIFHALNHKAVAKRYAKEIGKTYEEINVIVAHLGGGVSIGLHKKGKVVDVNNALGGEGPFSPERAGTLPIFDLIDYVRSSPKETEEIKRDLVKKGGLFSYLGSASGIEICGRINSGDTEAEFYLHAMAYQILKQIGSLYFANKGEIDAVIFTGGIVYQDRMRTYFKENMPKEIKIIFYPGEDEMEALNLGALSVILGKEEAKTYK